MAEKMNTVSVKNLRKNGEKWMADVTVIGIGDDQKIDFSTNDAGHGWWNGDTQCAGTSQFSLRGCKTNSAARARIVALFTITR